MNMFYLCTTLKLYFFYVLLLFVKYERCLAICILVFHQTPDRVLCNIMSYIHVVVLSLAPPTGMGQWYGDIE